jgi:hypothetical protein
MQEAESAALNIVVPVKYVPGAQFDRHVTQVLPQAATEIRKRKG